jgi:hypothetical protein
VFGVTLELADEEEVDAGLRGAVLDDVVPLVVVALEVVYFFAEPVSEMQLARHQRHELDVRLHAIDLVQLRQ